MGYDILVDGYNVIKNNEMYRQLELKRLALARETLIRNLKNRYLHYDGRVTVVFDGSDKREQVTHEEHICVIYTRYGETADSVIVRLAAEARAAGRKVMMYSDDAEVKEAVTEQGGKSHSTGTLTNHLSAPPRDLARRVAHRQKVRRMYGLDPHWKYIEDDEEENRSPQRKKKKKRR
ncbi:putative RNA-binding protein with PIN domain [Thermosporothrix hazakensis]|jgi:predicted RNA-binding protein with PIN domain|uniref:Putative RNA-binding protein with PIN domain n=1 Tax=Thermosporothrix hazakensis TaxID=644383 RepID=A0A326UDP0_THEHA|nr:NYN domain-containing protein [Thermosporothrix hazakensis]PZW32854.1 putative RNA-binding protein with PIN domain [Thermosporothrix hazakensis]GCE48885.1 hypothetical protein KTH_37540 [Thermosporothrix hazakensis]